MTRLFETMCVLIFILSLALFIADTTTNITGKIVLEDPFVIHANDTVSALYDMIKAKVSYVVASRGISIVFGGKIILNFSNDHRKIEDIGMYGTLNDIQIIPKPDFAALLEMVSGISNIQNIPWLINAMQSLSDQNVSKFLFGRGLEYDENGNLIGIDLSHLNLTGSIHLESLPSTVRSLDLSFNDLDFLHFDGLRGKSLEKLNVEHNKRCYLNIDRLCALIAETEHIPIINELKLSSNQIFPRITDAKEKDIRLRNCLFRHKVMVRMIVDGVEIVRGNNKSPLDLYSRMLRVVMGVTNKQVIPWYTHFFEGRFIPSREWKALGVEYKKQFGCSGSLASRYKFDLSGLGLEGEIQLGSLPRNVYEMDLSNNNLSGITFGGERVRFNLRALNLQNNDNLRIDLAEIELSRIKRVACLGRLVHLRLSSNQLTTNQMLNGIPILKDESIRLWLESTTVNRVVIDDHLYVK